MDWLSILNTLGISGVIAVVIPFLIQRYYNKKDNRDTERLKMRKDLSELKEEVDKHNIALKEIEDMIEVVSIAEKSLLKDRIIQMYNHYYNDKKYLPIYVRESLENMKLAYKNLDGENDNVDSVVEDLISTLEELPTKPIEY